MAKNAGKAAVYIGVFAALMGICGPTSAQTQDADGQLVALLKRHGIRPVSPPSQAVDITLPDLDGTETRLSAAKGRWVLLTFFATWCGPCAQEMPSLEQLHLARKSAGLEVIGVAIEPGVDKIAAFTRGKGVTFRILVDANSQAASVYRAASIPVSYLIDPAGRIAGVSRGARNWSAATGLIDDLLALIPPDADAASAYVAGGNAVELPSSLVPPDATVEVATAQPAAGEPFAIDVRIHWAGNFEDYLLLPPQVHLPDGVEHLGTSASTSSQQGRAVITYQVRLRANEAGSFALDPVEVRYTPRLEAQPVARRVSGPTVQVVTASIVGLRPTTFIIGIVGAALLLVGGVVGVGLRNRLSGGGEPTGPAATDHYTALAATLEAARRARMDGKPADFMAQIERFDADFDGPGAPPQTPPELAAMLDKVRYGGYTPPQQELDHMLRRAERRLAEIAPSDKHQENIKLKTPV